MLVAMLGVFRKRNLMFVVAWSRGPPCRQGGPEVHESVNPVWRGVIKKPISSFLVPNSRLGIFILLLIVGYGPRATTRAE
jgi:hypothetical protein